MKNRFLKIITCSIFLISLFYCSNIAFAQSAKDQFKSSLDKTGIGTGHLDANAKETGFLKDKTLTQAIGSVVGIALSLLGVFFLVLIIYAGYTWMVARGNAPEVEKAKNTIINATMGLLIVLGAYGITTFIASTFFN